MVLQIRLFGYLRDKVPGTHRGQLEWTLANGSSIAELLAALQLTGHMHVAVNGELVREWQRPLKNGDEIEIFHPAAGG